MPGIHTSPYAGTWYPDDPIQLLKLLQRQFERAARPVDAAPPAQDVAYVVPHAGLEYSGGVAASVYVRIEKARPRPIVLVGFSHSGSLRGITIPDFDAYTTPLGTIGTDQTWRRTLLGHKPFVSGTVIDHSIEIQLPLLRFAFPDAPVIPMYAGGMTEAEMESAADVLSKLIEQGAAVIASTDLTHYGTSFGYMPFPANNRAPAQLRLLDERITAAIMTLDLDMLLSTLRETGSTMCGVLPVSLLMVTLRKLRQPITPTLLAYGTSADVTGDYRTCVGYAALSFERSEPGSPARK